MNFKKDFPGIIVSVFGEDHQLSKQSETFLNLLCFEFIKKIVKKSNDLLNPIDYEKQIINKSTKKRLTTKEIETSIQLLFPKEIVDYFMKFYKNVVYYKSKIFFSESVTKNLIEKFISNNIKITKKSINFLTFITQTLIYDIFIAYEDIVKDTTITNKGLSKVFKEDKQLNELLKVLKISI